MVLNKYMPRSETFGLRTEGIASRLDLVSTCNLELLKNSCLTISHNYKEAPEIIVTVYETNDSSVSAGTELWLTKIHIPVNHYTYYKALDCSPPNSQLHQLPLPHFHGTELTNIPTGIQIEKPLAQG